MFCLCTDTYIMYTQVDIDMGIVVGFHPYYKCIHMHTYSYAYLDIRLCEKVYMLTCTYTSKTIIADGRSTRSSLHVYTCKLSAIWGPRLTANDSQDMANVGFKWVVVEITIPFEAPDYGRSRRRSLE